MAWGCCENGVGVLREWRGGVVGMTEGVVGMTWVCCENDVGVLRK